MHTGIHIGTIVDKQSLDPLTDSIVRIMTTPADQKTIRYALGLIGRAAEVRNVSVNDVSIIGEQHDHHDRQKEDADPLI